MDPVLGLSHFPAYKEKDIQTAGMLNFVTPEIVSNYRRTR